MKDFTIENIEERDIIDVVFNGTYDEALDMIYVTKNLRDLFELQLDLNNDNLVFERKYLDEVDSEGETVYTLALLNHKDKVAYKFQEDFEVARAEFLTQINLTNV